MKIIQTIILMPIFTFAFSFYGEKECEKNDVVSVDVFVSKDRLEPRIIYLKENDKVCLKVNSIDFNVSLSIEKHPVLITAKSGMTSFSFFKVKGPGTYKIDCKGGCALGVDAKIIVQSSADFDKWQEENYREKSEKYRKKIEEDSLQKKYLKEKDSFKKNPYDKQKYKSKFLEN